MVLTTRIDLPAPTRGGGGLLSAARPLPDGWERGVTFGQSSCLTPQPWPFCIDEENPFSPGEKIPQAGTDGIAVFEPTGIVQAVECTTLSRDRSQEKAEAALVATADYQLGQELYDGAVTGNPHLSTAVSAGAGGSWAEGLAVLEDGIASGLNGRLAYIHVTFGGLTRLLAEQAIWRDGRTWRSAAGNVVVTSSGYAWSGAIFATGEVFASVSPPETRVDIDRAINQSTAYAEQTGMAVFDPCFLIQATIEES